MAAGVPHEALLALCRCCRKDAGVLDEIPAAYKDLESVIAAQTSGPSPLVEVVARLTTLLCVKG